MYSPEIEAGARLTALSAGIILQGSDVIAGGGQSKGLLHFL